MNYQQIRSKAAVLKDTYGDNYLTAGRKGAMIGGISSAIKGAATAAGVSYNSQFREARQRLATEVYGRAIASYNSLTHGEIEALHQWATTQGLELKTWLIERYGKQTRF